MKLDLKELRALCDAATDGDWETEFSTKDLNTNAYVRVTCANPEKDGVCQLYWMDADRYVRNLRNHEANARFIAATDPQTVRALIDEIEKYRASLREIANRIPIHEDYGDAGRINYKRMVEITETAQQALK